MLNDNDVKFINAMREEVRERGENYVYSEPNPPEAEWSQYSSCFYVNGAGEASCIIGRTMVRAGFATVEEMSQCEGDAASLVMSASRLGFSTELVNAANEVQGEQDGGTAWGQAYQTMLVNLSHHGAVSQFAL